MFYCGGKNKTNCHQWPLSPIIKYFLKVLRCCCSVTLVSLFHPMDCSIPGFPDHHQLPELSQTHVHRVGDAIQPSHLLSSPSLPAFSLFQHQGLFQWVGSSHQVASVGVSASASVLPMNIQDWFPLGLTDLISLQFSSSPTKFVTLDEPNWHITVTPNP